MSMHSLEIVPKQLDRLKFLPDNKFEDVFVAFIPGDNYTNIVNASKSLLELNYNPIPHIPARTINNEDELDNFLKNLHSIGVKEVLVIGGSPKKQEGPFSKSMDLFKTGLFGKYKFKINIAGHPEGNPDDLDSDINLLEKSKWLYENKFIFSIVTQWTLDIDKTNAWILKIKNEIIKRNLGENVNIKIGIAGPAKLTTLINYAKICGVSATALIVRNKKLSLTKLVKHNPSEIISGLENYDQLHFFPFGGIKELTGWIEKKEG
tara:strand:+ start:6299 stop:7087 length:789 start_codon:yes stop_codon:yes gene_type:complete